MNDKYNLTQCIRGGSQDGRAGFLIAFNYNPELVELIKKIPHTHREWHEDTKTWWVSEGFEHTLKALFGNFEALVYLQGRLI